MGLRPGRPIGRSVALIDSAVKKGSEAAYGRRRPLRAKAGAGVSKALNRLAGVRRSTERADYLEVVARSRDATSVADVSARVNWYLRGREVPVFMDGASGVAIEPDAVPYMDPSLVHDPGWEEKRPEGRSELLVYDLTPVTGMRFVAGSRNASLCSPHFNFASDKGWFDVQRRYCRNLTSSPRDSMTKLLDLVPADGKAFLLATGPSAKDVDAEDVSADLRITCNSAVRDKDLLGEFRPNVIAFADRVFHFGPSRYAAAFRRDLLAAVELTDATLVTTDLWAGPLLAHLPELRDRTAVLPFRSGVNWHWPTLDEPWVRGTGNILSALMLPVAFALAENVTMAGCDGRTPGEHYFWRHNKDTQYADDLMQSAFATHPAFFAGRSYTDYYEKHCRELEELCSDAEADGKTIFGVTPSHIPALRKRGAPSFAG
jgi:hypothetical protein